MRNGKVLGLLIESNNQGRGFFEGGYEKRGKEIELTL